MAHFGKQQSFPHSATVGDTVEVNDRVYICIEKEPFKRGQWAVVNTTGNIGEGGNTYFGVPLATAPANHQPMPTLEEMIAEAERMKEIQQAGLVDDIIRLRDKFSPGWREERRKEQEKLEAQRRRRQEQIAAAARIAQELTQARQAAIERAKNPPPPKPVIPKSATVIPGAKGRKFEFE